MDGAVIEPMHTEAHRFHFHSIRFALLLSVCVLESDVLGRGNKTGMLAKQKLAYTEASYHCISKCSPFCPGYSLKVAVLL